MTSPQIISLCALLAVVAILIWGKLRSEIVALTGAAVLLVTHTIRPIDVQGAFASPAIITLASLLVITYAMELSGLMGSLVRGATRLSERLGAKGLWLVIAASGAASAFLNNTPIVLLVAPVVREVAESLGRSPKRFLIPLSYATILGGACTLIGTARRTACGVRTNQSRALIAPTPLALSAGIALPKESRDAIEKRKLEARNSLYFGGMQHPNVVKV